jgi:pantothenate kinase
MNEQPAAVDANALALAGRVIEAAGDNNRFVTAIAGPPGSGKSTLAGAVAKAINAQTGQDCATVFPMDGYHFDDAILQARGDRPRKGAPFTFDVEGYRHTLMRLRGEKSNDVAVPVFDRSLELSRGSARLITAKHRFVISEGNYLLLDEAPWNGLAPMFDLTVLLIETEAELMRRLNARWVYYGLTAEEISAKMEGNEMPNVRLVLNNSRKADIILAAGQI